MKGQPSEQAQLEAINKLINDIYLEPELQEFAGQTLQAEGKIKLFWEKYDEAVKEVAATNAQLTPDRLNLLKTRLILANVPPPPKQ